MLGDILDDGGFGTRVVRLLPSPSIFRQPVAIPKAWVHGPRMSLVGNEAAEFAGGSRLNIFGFVRHDVVSNQIALQPALECAGVNYSLDHPARSVRTLAGLHNLVCHIEA